jgi:hypothetical protein
MDGNVGDKAICAGCGAAIVFVGPYWDHIGEIKPRHPALPKLPVETAPLQPNWTKQLDSREWSQVLHAQSYAQNHSSAGAPGHGQFLLIAKLAKMLDACEPFENGGPE